MPTGFVLPTVDPTTIAPPPSGQAALVVDLINRLTIISSTGAITPINPINQTSDQVITSASAGNQSVGPGNGVHVCVVNMSGPAGVRQFSLNKVGMGPAQTGWQAKIVFLFPGQVAGIRFQVFDANTLGQNLLDEQTDGIQGSAVANFHFDGAQWQIDDFKMPATS